MEEEYGNLKIVAVTSLREQHVVQGECLTRNIHGGIFESMSHVFSSRLPMPLFRMSRDRTIKVL